MITSSLAGADDAPQDAEHGYAQLDLVVAGLVGLVWSSSAPSNASRMLALGHSIAACNMEIYPKITIQTATRLRKGSAGSAEGSGHPGRQVVT